MNTSFEILALGLGFHIASKSEHRTDYQNAAKGLWEGHHLADRFATGLATQDRLVKTVPLGRRLMADPVEATEEILT